MIAIAALPGRRFEAHPPKTKMDSCLGCVFHRAFYENYIQPNNHPMSYDQKVLGCNRAPNCEGHIYKEVGFDPSRS